MAHDSVDATRGFPQYSAVGAPADAADLSEVAAWAGANIDRAPVATIAALGTLPLVWTGMVQRVTPLLGCFFQYNGTTWDMVGIPYLASAGALAAAIPSPVTGMTVRITTERFNRRWNGSAWKPDGTGLFPIIPTVAVGGGAGSVATDGRIILTAATATIDILTLPSDFEDFLFLINGDTVSSLSLGLQVVLSGSAQAAALYDGQMSWDASSAHTANAPTTAQTSLALAPSNPATISRHTLEVRGLTATKPTVFHDDYFSSTVASGANQLSGRGDGSHRNSTAYDGIRLILNSAFTGTIEPFGVFKG